MYERMRSENWWTCHTKEWNLGTAELVIWKW